VNEEVATPSQLIEDIVALKVDEGDIVSLLPVLEHLVLELAPIRVEHPLLDKFSVESSTHARVFLERCLPV